MKKLAVLVCAVALGGSTLAVATLPAQGAPFAAGECTINLEPSYVTNDENTLLTFPPASALSCLGFTFDPEFDSVVANFVTSAGDGFAQLTTITDLRVDPVTNTQTYVKRLQLTGTAMAAPYTRLVPASDGSYDPNFKVTHNGQTYLVKLGAPFAIVNGYTGNICTLTMPKLSFTWGQASNVSIPDSAMQCTGFTWNSNDYDYYGVFQTESGTTIRVATASSSVYDPATKTTKITVGLEAQLPLGTSSSDGFTLRSRGSSHPGSANGAFGSYTQIPEGSATGLISQQLPRVSYPVTLAKPFIFKAATTVTATPTSIAGKPRKLSIQIAVDRNQSFQNGTKPSYRRQPVIPGRNADHPTILRGGKEIKTVTLSKFGEATVTVKNPKGKQKFTVQLPKTASNYAGSTTFRD